jgi:hypothetical protein
MKTVAPATNESTISSCRFTFSGTPSIGEYMGICDQSNTLLRVSRPRHSRLNARQFSRCGSRECVEAQISVPSETASCCACAWADERWRCPFVACSI